MDALYPASEPGIPGLLDDSPRLDAQNAEGPTPDGDDGWDEDGWDGGEDDADPDDGEDWDDDGWDDDDDEEEEEGEWDDDDPDFADEDDEEWDEEPRLESRFLGLAAEDREERIRRRTLPLMPPRRQEKNHPPRGGVRRDANPSRDDEPPD